MYFLWAKKTREEPCRYHHLLWHLLDTVCTTRGLLDQSMGEAFLGHFSEHLEGDKDSVKNFVSLLTGLHDIGKATPGFQQNDLAIKNQLEDVGFVFPSYCKFHHSVTTAIILPELLIKKMGLRQEVANDLATCLGGHHGIFPRSKLIIEARDHEAAGGDKWTEARAYLFNQMLGVLKPGRLPVFRDQPGSEFYMVLAGLTSVADWVASNEDFFPYAPANETLEGYFKKTQIRASKAIESLKWKWQPPKSAASFRAIFPHIQNPRPLQQQAEHIAEELEGPALVIIEAPTGEGKTEAAMFLADRFYSSRGQKGCYFALPTQATSNQMFTRLRDFLNARYPAGDFDPVNLMLLHGHADLSAEFELLRQNKAGDFSVSGVEADGLESSDSNLVAMEWFTFRKRGLLAPFGVGTIDQALLSVLQTKHVFVRLFGLAGKTLVVDEVHAYDTYMSALLERLLGWLGAVGCSVVMLSATLPSQRRRKLLQAYNSDAKLPESEPSYPRISWTTAGESAIHAAHIETSEQSKRELGINSIADDLESLSALLSRRIEDGGCAAVICNTVRKAQEVYLALRERFPGDTDDGRPIVDLLHSRYMFRQRQEREKRCLKRFGHPEARVEGEPVRRPRQAILVSTQIIEQSLDLDFDMMVSQLAPIDLLIQRAGRLCRHERKDRPEIFSPPNMWIMMPETNADGCPEFDSGTAAVYDQHILLRTWLGLRNSRRTSIRVPEDVEELIEMVYGESENPERFCAPISKMWDYTARKHQKSLRGELEEARTRWIKKPTYGGPLWRINENAREEDAPKLHKEFRALTRLGGLSVTAICLRESDQWDKTALDAGTIRKLLQSTVRISHYKITEKLLEQAVPEKWKKSKLLRHCRLLRFDSSWTAKLGEYTILLDKDVGLKFEKEE